MELQPHNQGLEATLQPQEVTQIVRVLEDKRDEAVSNRSEVESRWLRDLQQFEGNTLDRLTKGATDHRSAVRKAPPVVHLTRTRTLSIAARIINMLVPSNERSWNIEPTPVPELIKATEDDTPVLDDYGQPVMIPDEQAPPVAPMGPPPGPPAQPPYQDPNMDPSMEGGPPQQQDPMMAGPQQPPPQRPVTNADLAREELEEAERKSEAMRDHMDDQLAECFYNREQRKVIVDGCKIGTGILEGPVVTGSFKKIRFQNEEGQWVTQTQEEPAPEFKCIDPWCFYPMPAEHISRCEGVFIDRPMTRREVQELKLLPGFDPDMINEVLMEEPAQSEKYSASLISRANITGDTIPTNTRYTVWKFVGSLNRKDMDALGVDVDEEEDVVDPIIEAWFCNTRLLKIKRHALEGTYRLPYYVWNYEESENSIFGYGVPYLMRDSDRVIQSTWHMILHNAAMSAGSHIVRDKDAVEPADGSQEITGGTKQWYFTDPEKRISDAFGVFNIPPNIENLTAVHERARQNADEELAFPLLAQGEPSEAVPTSSGLAMLMNASNVVQRRIAQSYDDEIIEPSLNALYDYNMTYLDDDDAKGDMKIRAEGATKLVVKDMQTQHLLVIADMTTNDRFAPLMKDDQLLRKILKAAEIDADELMKSDEEMADKGPSEREIAENEHLQAQTEKLRAEAAKLNADMQQPQAQGMDESDLAELQWRYDKLESELQIQQMKLEQAAVEASGRLDISSKEIEARFELGARADETKRLLAQLEDRRKQATDGYLARLKAEELAQKQVNMKRGFDTYG